MDIAFKTMKVRGRTTVLVYLEYTGPTVDLNDQRVDAVRRKFWNFMDQRITQKTYTQSRADIYLPQVKAQALSHLRESFRAPWIEHFDINHR